MATPSEALQHPLFNPLAPDASEEAKQTHLKQVRLRLQFLQAQYRMQWAAQEDTTVTTKEIGVFRRMLIAHKDTATQMKHVDESIVRINKRVATLTDELKQATAVVTKIQKQMAEQQDQLEGMKTTRMELLEMQEVEQEYADTVELDTFMMTQVADANEDPYQSQQTGGEPNPQSGLPPWRRRQSMEARLDAKITETLQPMQATILQLGQMMQAMMAGGIPAAAAVGQFHATGAPVLTIPSSPTGEPGPPAAGTNTPKDGLPGAAAPASPIAAPAGPMVPA